MPSHPHVQHPKVLYLLYDCDKSTFESLEAAKPTSTIRENLVLLIEGTQALGDVVTLKYCQTSHDMSGGGPSNGYIARASQVHV